MNQDDFQSCNLPSSEDLDAVITEHELKTHGRPDPHPTIPETTVNNVNKNVAGICFKCDRVAINFCHHCGQEFCSEHRSKYSTEICYLCITIDNLGLEFVDLVDESPDEDGVLHTHRGRRIKLIGEGWPNAMQMIETLTDEGLEVFIAERKRLLQEAVQLGEYHRITLSAAEFKKEYNRRSKRAALRRRSEELRKQGAVRLGGRTVQMGASQSKAKSPDEKAFDAMRAFSPGLTWEQYQAFKKLVAK